MNKALFETLAPNSLPSGAGVSFFSLSEYLPIGQYNKSTQEITSDPNIVYKTQFEK